MAFILYNKSVYISVIKDRYSSKLFIFQDTREVFTMGLIKAGMGAVGGVLGDQWKEFIYCESMTMCWFPRA